MRTLGWLLLAIGFFYAAFSGFMAIRTWIDVSGIVDTAVDQRAKQGAGAVRTAILEGAAKSGVALDDRQLVVTEEGRRLQIQLRWSYPVVTWEGQEILAIPLSVERSALIP